MTISNSTSNNNSGQYIQNTERLAELNAATALLALSMGFAKAEQVVDEYVWQQEPEVLVVVPEYHPPTRNYLSSNQRVGLHKYFAKKSDQSK